MSSPSLLSHFYKTRDEYRSNADRALLHGEYRKASELLWGALTQQIKALAALHDIAIESHRHFFDFMRGVSAETQDPSFYSEFVHLNALHKNFYDETIPPDIFPDYYRRTTELIERLDSLVTAES